MRSLPPGVTPWEIGEVDDRADQVMVSMRDGIRLATDVYLPSRTPAPTVLVRLPYDKSGRFSFMGHIAPWFLERGYAFVAQDVRGKVRSEGGLFAFVSEVRDGADTLEWITEQSWSDGTVGMFGDSYYGFTQWAAAVSGHPALRAIVPRSTSSEIGTDWMYHGGVYCLYTTVEWATGTWVDRNNYDVDFDWTVRPLDAILPGLHGGRRSRSLDAWRRTPAGDAFWTEGIYGVREPRAHLRVPALHSGGWWDVFQRGQVRDYRSLVAAGAPGQHLYMGSTDHFDDQLHPDGRHGVDVLGDEAELERWLPTYVGPALGFFERYLLGREEEGVPAVRWHLANHGWRHSPTWPPPGARRHDLFLAGAARAGAGPEGGRLADRPDAGSGEAAWTHDPGSPVPDLIKDAWHPLEELPDERDVEVRDDVLTFSGPELTRHADLAGPVELHVPVRAGGTRMHLVAKLVDVFPSGRARRILQGARLVEPRDGFQPVVVDLGNTGYRIEPGHRLRVEVASSMFPRYLWDSGDGEDPWTAERHRTRRDSIQIGEGSLLRLTELDTR